MIMAITVFHIKKKKKNHISNSSKLSLFNYYRVFMHSQILYLLRESQDLVLVYLKGWWFTCVLTFSELYSEHSPEVY